jgi:hypothetical protein
MLINNLLFKKLITIYENIRPEDKTFSDCYKCREIQAGRINIGSNNKKPKHCLFN